MAKKACCGEVRMLFSDNYSLGIWNRRFNKRLASCSQFHKDRKRKRSSRQGGEDLTSVLPDEILAAILSFLTIKEAGRCSTLSRRWRYLWTFYTGKFGYDYGKISWGDEYDKLSCISKILKSHRGSVMDELVIRFPGKSIHSPDIDSWVYFASEKNVRRFELDLTPISPWVDYKQRYRFPGIRNLSGSNGGGFSSLTCLCLACVNVTGKVLKHLLATCLFLKEMVVRNSISLKFLKVSGEALRLESLQVYGCFQLTTLIIDADKLVSLAYDGKSKSLVLKNAPSLSKLTISGNICKSVNDMSCKHFSFIQHLECLKMELPRKASMQPPVPPPRFPKMYRLKHLALDIQWTYGSTLLYYTSLFEACPLLSRFSMQYARKKVIPGQVLPAEGGAPDFEHECLKVVELIGFMGQRFEFELVFHLLKIAVSIEKLIIVTGPWFPYGSRERVKKQLAVRLPISADLVML